MKVASVTVMAMTQGLTAGRLLLTRGNAMDAVVETHIAVSAFLMQLETSRSHPSMWYDATSDQSVAR